MIIIIIIIITIFAIVHSPLEFARLQVGCRSCYFFMTNDAGS